MTKVLTGLFLILNIFANAQDTSKTKIDTLKEVQIIGITTIPAGMTGITPTYYVGQLANYSLSLKIKL